MSAIYIFYTGFNIDLKNSTLNRIIDKLQCI